MDPIVSNILIILAILAGSAATISIAYGVTQYVRTRKGDAVFSQMVTWAKILVHNVEQQMSLDGPRKKEIVMLELKRLRDRMGSTLTDQQLEQILEASVNMMNSGLRLIGEPIELDSTLDRLKLPEE